MNWAGDALRWGGVGAAVVAAHVAGVIWVDRAAQRNPVMALPAPVFAELLPEPAAPAPSAEAAPAEESAAEPEAEPEPQPQPEPEPEQAEAPPPEPVPDFEVPPLTELPPITDFSELVPESTLALTASERPRTRPERPAPEPQQVRREEKPEPPKEQPKRERRREPAPAQTQKAERAAPSENATSQKRGGPAQGQSRASTGASKAQMDSWTSKVGGRVAAHMKRTRVPGGGRGSVTIQVSISISGNGSASARVTSSTGNAQVDAALARQAGRMPRMPAPPNGRGASFVLPIRIDL